VLARTGPTRASRAGLPRSPRANAPCERLIGTIRRNSAAALAYASNRYSVAFTMSTIWRRWAFDSIFADHNARGSKFLRGIYPPLGS
jgi:transposase